MAEKYYSILTNRGKTLQAAASVSGVAVVLKDFVIGDGNGVPVTPDPAKTSLSREVYRSAISSLEVSPDQDNQFIAHLVIPANVGGFTVREVGLLTDAGELYAVSNSPAIEKPESGINVNLQFRLAVSETANIELKVATGDGLFLRQDANLGDVKDKEASRKNIGLGRLAVKDKVTSQDIFDAQAIHLGESADLNDYTTPGLYYQPANVNAQTGKNYPEPNAGSLEIYKSAGVTQIYRVYINSRSYIRSYYNGSWSPWVMQYDKENRPTAAEVNAVSADGGSYNKPFAFGSVKTVPSESNTAEMFSQTGGGGTVVSGVNVQWYDNKFTVGIVRGGSTDTDGFVIQHNGYTRLRIDNDGNLTSVGTVNAGGAQFSTVGDAYGTTWSGWLSTWLNNQFATRDKNINARATPDWVNSRIQDVQNWTAQNFVQSVRLGGKVFVNPSPNDGYASLTAPAGHALTAILDSSTSRWPMPDSPDYAYACPVQVLINGQWMTVGQL